jgi:penicillin-binding protein 1A
VSIAHDQDIFDHRSPVGWEQDLSQPEPPASPPPRRPGRGPLGRVLLLLAWPGNLLCNGLLAGLLATCGLYLWVAPDLPGDQALGDVRLQQPLRVYSADGQLMAEIGAERREPLAYADTPPLLVKAFLAAEDSRFFEHAGIDVQGLLRAALSLVRTGERSQGGSTITMQVVRNLFLTPEKSFHRKLSELALALRLESRLSKQRIFELYENKIFFGHQAYGIAAAARTYYDKAVGELTLAQMATLAGIPQAPSTHNPVTSPRRALARRRYVLERMRALGWISQAQYVQASAAPEDAHLTRAEVDLDAPYVAEMARQEMVRRYGEAAYTSGLRVITTVDTRLQREARAAVTRALLEYDRRHGYRGPEGHAAPTPRDALDDLLADHPPVQGLEPALVLGVSPVRARLYLGNGREAALEAAGAAWARPPAGRRKGAKGLAALIHAGDLIRVQRNGGGLLELAQIPAVEGALVALTPGDGEIKALVGGFDFTLSQFNRAVDAHRQPGSSFKPFVYAAALARGWTPASLLDDSPLTVRDGNRLWRPKNFDSKYLGLIRLRQALAESRNLAAVHLLQALGVDYARQFAARFGFRPKQLPNGLSLVLGSGEAAPLDMAAAYATFANGGFRVTPYLVARVEAADGHTLFQADPAVACQDCAEAPPSDAKEAAQVLPAGARRAEQVLTAQTDYLMRSLLGEVIRSGTGRRAQALGRQDLAGKTGTSNDQRDAWFCGFQSSLAAVAWMGFDDFSPLGRGEVGGHGALGMWMGFMGPALTGRPEQPPREPPGLVHVQIDRRDGTLTYAGDPDAMDEVVPEDYTPMLLGPSPPEVAAPPAPGPEDPRPEDIPDLPHWDRESLRRYPASGPEPRWDRDSLRHYPESSPAVGYPPPPPPRMGRDSDPQGERDLRELF